MVYPAMSRTKSITQSFVNTTPGSVMECASTPHINSHLQSLLLGQHIIARHLEWRYLSIVKQRHKQGISTLYQVKRNECPSTDLQVQERKTTHQVG